MVDGFEDEDNLEEEENDELDAEDRWEESRDNLEAVSFVCEDCDYRWEEQTEEEIDTDVMVCPMCGSINVTEL